MKIHIKQKIQLKKLEKYKQPDNYYFFKAEYKILIKA